MRNSPPTYPLGYRVWIRERFHMPNNENTDRLTKLINKLLESGVLDEIQSAIKQEMNKPVELGKVNNHMLQQASVINNTIQSGKATLKLAPCVDAEGKPRVIMCLEANGGMADVMGILPVGEMLMDYSQFKPVAAEVPTEQPAATDGPVPSADEVDAMLKGLEGLDKAA
jgi:hypothetical protein